MRAFRHSIFWKLLLTLLACIIITSLIMALIYYPFVEGGERILPPGVPSLIFIITIAVFTALLSRILTHPIRELTKVAQEMSKGNFGVKVEVRSKDEIGQLGTTFNEMSQRLADYHKLRMELLADISHEIRSPLARIQSDAEILIDRQMEKEEMAQHLKAICEEVRNIDQLIEDLSMLTRLEQNQVELKIVPSSLENVLAQAIAKFLLQMEEKRITVVQNIPPNIPLVMMDSKRIGQVVSNLLMNSLRYTPEGGNVEIGAQERNGMVEVWVKDTGPGIPQEAIPYIFDRFYRVDKSRSRATGGRGLGLAIARQFVKAHGGQIRAESEIGKGTSITFSLPIAP
ncbi:MAG TPA: HAMP domain-containing sensor histidine kinase [Thermodesulfobacteriota bacterium]|nr:HAMP domain-containing sensor histidine kinase [Thermodesulfobacteriota bacterium]